MTTPNTKINKKLNGIELTFERKPSKQVLEKLRRKGFRWSPKHRHWYKSRSTLLKGLECTPKEYESTTLGKLVDVYQKISDMILETIDSKKDLSWRKPWNSINTYGFAATNFISKKPYRGINSILLNFIIPELRKQKWDIPYFMTFNQIEKRGGTLRKGAKAYVVTYFQMIYKVGDHKITEQQYWDFFVKCAEDKNPVYKGLDVCKNLVDIPVLRYYNVYNADDIEGIDWKLKPVEEKTDFDKIESAEGIIEYYPEPKPKFINVDPAAAFYRSLNDSLNMPPKEAFETEQNYYCTFFHELIHSTGSKRRLNRKLGNKFGNKDYSFEELIAELGASYLCGESGILFFTLNNSAAYIKGWKKRLREFIQEDNKFFLKATSKAQEAADFMLQRDSKGVPKYLRKQAIQLKLSLARLGEKTDELKIIRQFKNLPEKTRTKRQLESLLDQIHSGKQSQHSELIREIENRLVKMQSAINGSGATRIKIEPDERLIQRCNQVIENPEPLKSRNSKSATTKPKTPKSKTPKLQTPVLNGIPLSDEFTSDPKPVKKSGESGESGKSVVSVDEIMSMEFETLAFTGKWKNFLQNPAKNMRLAIWGKPKNGKSVLATKLARYLSNFGNVLYNFADQGINASTKEILRISGLATRSNVDITDTRSLNDLENEVAAGQYQFVVIDMVNTYIHRHKIKPHNFEDRFLKKYPDTSFILIFETIKTGNFKGDQGWTHIVDGLVEVEEFLAKSSGRYGNGEFVVWGK